MASRTWVDHGALAAVLALAAASGCFTDGGSPSTTVGETETDTPTSAGPGGSSSDASETSSATSTNGTAGTAMTSSATMTSGSTDATTGSSGPEPDCDLAPQCQPDEVELGAECGGCGQQERVCGDDCGWGEWSCAFGESCAIWHLPDGAQEWTVMELAPAGGADLAPDDPIQAAFDTKHDDIAYVLTEQEYHALDLASLTWLERGDRMDLFQEASEQNLEGALSVNKGESNNMPASTDEVVILYSDEDYWMFDFDADTQIGSFIDEDKCCDGLEDWGTAHAPDPANIRGIWLNWEGNAQWHAIDLAGCDGIEESTPMTAYAGFIVVEDTVRLQDYGPCDDFVETALYDSYEPFTYPYAPPSPDFVGAALYSDGLYVFKANI